MEKIVLIWKRIKSIIIPLRLRNWISIYTSSTTEKLWRNKILLYLEEYKNADKSYKEVLGFLRANKIHIFPYNFIFDYNPLDIKVFHEDGLPFVLFERKKLFFKRGMSDYQVMNAMNNLLIEQDKRSAHCYFNFIQETSRKQRILDIGAAEGIFALKLIDQVDSCIIVETDQSWIEALEHTFKPYSKKVSICNKFVSNIDDDRHISMDNLIENKKLDIVKIDVDGNEHNLFLGFNKELLKKSTDQILLCVYHDVDDFEKYSKLLHDYGYKIQKNESKMIFYYGENLRPPYLSYGVISANLN